MRKIFSITFLAVYVVLTAGMNIVIHTCGGEASASIATSVFKDPCGCSDEMPTEDMCCTVSIKSIQIDDEQLSAAQFISQNIFLTDILPLELFSIPLTGNYSTTLFSLDTSPPLNEAIHISHCVFLI
jgi:hypothetical protein